MEHSKEPWRLGIGYAVVADDPVPEVSGSEHVEYYGGHLIAESVVHRNSRRIVACVNALVGWDTATLERYAQGGAPGNPNLGQKFSELNIAREQRDELQSHLAKANDALAVTAEQRDQAWAELRAIREAIGANPEESTLDEVVSKLISKRDNLLGALEFMVERIAEPPEANCSCHLSPPCNDCVDYGGEREAFETAKAEIAEARNAK